MEDGPRSVDILDEYVLGVTATSRLNVPAFSKVTSPT
jgi:hypothetical protein